MIFSASHETSSIQPFHFSLCSFRQAVSLEKVRSAAEMVRFKLSTLAAKLGELNYVLRRLGYHDGPTAARARRSLAMPASFGASDAESLELELREVSWLFAGKNDRH